MKLIFTVYQTQAYPKKFEWMATCPDGSRYAGSSSAWGSSQQAKDEAERTFDGLILEYTHPAVEELGKPLYQGCVFVAETAPQAKLIAKPEAIFSKLSHCPVGLHIHGRTVNLGLLADML